MLVDPRLAQLGHAWRIHVVVEDLLDHAHNSARRSDTLDHASTKRATLEVISGMFSGYSQVFHEVCYEKRDCRPPQTHGFLSCRGNTHSTTSDWRVGLIVSCRIHGYSPTAACQIRVWRKFVTTGGQRHIALDNIADHGSSLS